MATQTPNLHLVKPGREDPADISVINGNMDRIDAAIRALDPNENVPDVTDVLQYLDDCEAAAAEARAAVETGLPDSVLDTSLGFLSTNNLIVQSGIAQGYISTSTGSLVDPEDGVYFSTGFLPVTAGHGYRGSFARATAWYDANMDFLSGFTYGGGPEEAMTAPASAAYCRFTMRYADLPIRNALFYDRTTAPSREIRMPALRLNAEQVTDRQEYTWDGLPYTNAAAKRHAFNLVDGRDCVNNAYINVNTGAVEGGYPAYFCTGFLPVAAGNTYRASRGRNHAWYDSEKAFLSGGSGTGIQGGVTAPENAAYLRFTVSKSADKVASPDQLYCADQAHYAWKPDNAPWCFGMTINWIGDSIVAGQDFDETVCAALGLTETDYGINGSTIGLKADGTDGRDALCLRYAEMGDADIIAVSAGTNDFQYSWGQVGTIDSTENTTFYGALKALCEGLITKYPQKLIFFTTPIKRAQPPYADPFAQNERGLTLRDYCDIIKEVCAYYSIPVLDLYAESLLNPQLSAQQELFDEAKTHPTAAGQSILAQRVCGWLAQLGYRL